MRRFHQRRMLLAAWALLALPSAQTRERTRRIGCLFGGSPKTHERALGALRSGLAEHGWVEGRNIAVELRWAEGRMDRVPSLAAELVQSKPDVIVTAATPLIAELKKATSSIPIVMATGADPVESGLVTSLARPGGNLTGLSGFYEATPIKMLELARALLPRGSRVAALLEANTQVTRQRYRDELAITAKSLELRMELFEAASVDDIARILGALAADRPDALIVLPGPMMFAAGSDLIRRTGGSSLPVIYPFEETVDAGGLLSYAADLLDSYRRAARYVDRILRGARPGDLPIEQPTRLSLAVNLRTAKAQGIRIPQSILERADRIIE